MKLEYILGAGLVLLWLRGNKKIAASTQVKDSIPTEGTDWIGTAWDRLNGAQDLTAKGYPNLAAGAQADPGKVGQLSAGLSTGWDGTLAGQV